ncbi:MAG TPA: DoxX family protein [Bryobacteraceae bacterium]|jgi:putative oxidoreductase|nr:DoxX family protein [Bryobacteraceae bacterium]
MNAALLFLRIATSVVFLYHGSSILFGAFGGPGPARFAALLHVPLFVAYLVGIGQFFGAIGILLGIFTRIAAGAIVVIMLGAIFMVHISHGFDLAHGGFEYAFTELLIAMALAFTGPGAYSLAALMPPRLQNL